MNTERPLISFDWAIKKLLRQKANYVILEGFLSELFKFDVIIDNILESQGNQEAKTDKYNCVDILCKNTTGELILVELQYDSEIDYFYRMLFGTSKLITDNLKVGDDYDKVKKVYSVNIVYFELGQGDDYVYFGKTEFRGIHNHDILQVNATQKTAFQKSQVYQFYPEYYIIRVNKFNDIAKDTLDEWIFYLKNNTLPAHYKAKGLEQVAENLKITNMTQQEKINYNAHLKNIAVSHGVIETAKIEGKIEGQEETCERCLLEGFSIEITSKISGLSEEQVLEIKERLGI
jgi:predicted transposase/invertase (TIGR01784 family)